MPTPCIQSTEITGIKKDIWFLQDNHGAVMEVIKEIKEDVKDIKKYIFEGGLDGKYARKESVSRLWNFVWAIIWTVATVIGTYLLSKVLK